MGNEIRRTGDVRVKLAPEMMVRLSAMASDYGMPEATFAAFAIADFINRQENNKRLASMAVLDVTRRAGEQLPEMNEEMLQRVFGPMLAEMGKAVALSQANLPLDGEAAKAA